MQACHNYLISEKKQNKTKQNSDTFKEGNGRSSEKIVCHRVVLQKSAQDSGKDDEIAVDARFRHWDNGSKRPLGNDGGVAGGREISSAALRKYREDFQIESSSS